ncbi:MAG: hypothetical protein DRR19_17370 [Candidatus Parabeggiatoa sp. nov. 1]|nr:MAG: hypothetical protein DRR19_17370 [Gammaproteobacteria bacterium]
MINGWQSFIIIVLLQLCIFANKFIYQFGFKRILEYESGKVDDAIANTPYKNTKTTKMTKTSTRKPKFSYHYIIGQ